MKLNWNFLGGVGVQNKNLPWGEYGYFLELHNNRPEGHRIGQYIFIAQLFKTA